jgi:glycosyltransferase involved in cell wall biosynthesis
LGVVGSASGLVVILHEWAGLHPLRRHAFRPALLMADQIVLFSPQVRRELEGDRVVGHLARRAVLAPLPPNVRRPRSTRIIPLARDLAEARRDGRMVLGAFGAIYPGKEPEALLAVVAALKARGKRPLLAMIGSFVRGMDRVEENFWARAAALGLRDDVIVSGYVGPDEDLYGLFDQVDVFLSIFSEGLTARRSSVLATVQSGRPIVATAPATPEEFAHHPRFRALIEGGAITLVPSDASPEAYADAALAAATRPTQEPELDVGTWWRDAAEAIRPHL